MALIESFDGPRKRRGKIHDVVHCELTLVETDQGLIVQIDNFGRPTRKCEPKVSQSIQLDRNSALSLIRQIVSAYPEIRRELLPDLRSRDD